MTDAGRRSKPPGDSEPIEREVQNLQATSKRLAEELREARRTIERLKERLRVQNSELRESSKALTEIRLLSQQLERQAMILEHDDAIARRLQESLRPLWLADVDAVDFVVESVPGVRVGGDFCDIIKLSDSVAGLLIADVSGYGLPAAVVMTTARMAFRTFSSLESSAKAIMDKVNGALLDAKLGDRHCTAFLGLLDSEMLTLQYVNASHRPPYLVRGKEIIPLDTEGLFVGVLEEPQYEQKSIQLEHKDKLLLYTDGLIKLFDGEVGEIVAAERLRGFLRENSALPLRELVRGLSRRIVKEPKDDVAMLGVELLRSRARSKKISISSIPGEARRAEDAILPTLSARGYGERALFAVKLALEEAVINSIRHGNQLDPTKKVRIEFTLDDDKAVISVADEGEGFDPASVPDPTLEENLEITAGRGLVLMRAYMDKVEFNETGNKVTMTKYAPWRRGQS